MPHGIAYLREVRDLGEEPMPLEDFFARWMPEFARQAGSTRENAGRQAEDDSVTTDCIRTEA